MLVNVARADQPEHDFLPFLDIWRARHDRDALSGSVLDGSQVQAVGVGVLLQLRHLAGVDILPFVPDGVDMLYFLPCKGQLAGQLLHRNVDVDIVFQPRKWRS